MYMYIISELSQQKIQKKLWFEVVKSLKGIHILFLEIYFRCKLKFFDKSWNIIQEASYIESF